MESTVLSIFSASSFIISFVVEATDSGSLRMLVTFLYDVDGAGHIQGSEGTTVYLDDNVMRAEPRELDTGLSILRQKVAGVCPSCGDDVESFGNHYRDSRECREAERV
jgi:hypothetical protein